MSLAMKSHSQVTRRSPLMPLCVTSSRTATRSFPTFRRPRTITSQRSASSWRIQAARNLICSVAAKTPWHSRKCLSTSTYLAAVARRSISDRSSTRGSPVIHGDGRSSTLFWSCVVCSRPGKLSYMPAALSCRPTRFMRRLMVRTNGTALASHDGKQSTKRTSSRSGNWRAICSGVHPRTERMIFTVRTTRSLVGIGGNGRLSRRR